MPYPASNTCLFKSLAWFLSIGFSVCASAHAQTAPPLGQAGAFAVLGGSTVTNTGSSVITGELGVSPGSAITGFPPGIVVGGSLHSADAQATQAQSDVVSAYNALALQPPTAILTGQDLGGLTLVEGVYVFSSSAQLTGALTLDAQGNNDAVFIFQIGSTLTTASAASVRIINGGSNCRVFWQVGSSAVLGTGTSFIGNILALASITLNTNATISGRLLARNGAVVLDTNTATVCAECTALTVTPATLPDAFVGVPYSQTLVTTGGTAPYTYALTDGALPAGMTLSTTTGELTGTPTVASTTLITISVTDSAGCSVLVTFALTVSPQGCTAISLSPDSLSGFVAGVPYAQTLTAGGGTAPYTFTLFSGFLPPGITLAAAGPSSASLAGTPTAQGNYEFVIAATDATGCRTSILYSVRVGAPPLGLPSTGALSLLLLAGLVLVVGVRAGRRRAA